MAISPYTSINKKETNQDNFMTKKDAKINVYMRCVMMMAVFWISCGFGSCGDNNIHFMKENRKCLTQIRNTFISRATITSPSSPISTSRRTTFFLKIQNLKELCKIYLSHKCRKTHTSHVLRRTKLKSCSNVVVYIWHN